MGPGHMFACKSVCQLDACLRVSDYQSGLLGCYKDI